MIREWVERGLSIDAKRAADDALVPVRTMGNHSLISILHNDPQTEAYRDFDTVTLM